MRSKSCCTLCSERTANCLNRRRRCESLYHKKKHIATRNAITAITTNRNKRYPNIVLPHLASGVLDTTNVRGSVGGLIAPVVFFVTAVKEYPPEARRFVPANENVPDASAIATALSSSPLDDHP